MAPSGIADEALSICEREGFAVSTVVVARNAGDKAAVDVGMKDGRDVWYQDVVSQASTEIETEWMGAEDPLFILYTRYGQWCTWFSVCVCTCACTFLTYSLCQRVDR